MLLSVQPPRQPGIEKCGGFNVCALVRAQAFTQVVNVVVQIRNELRASASGGADVVGRAKAAVEARGLAFAQALASAFSEARVRQRLWVGLQLKRRLLVRYKPCRGNCHHLSGSLASGSGRRNRFSMCQRCSFRRGTSHRIRKSNCHRSCGRRKRIHTSQGRCNS